MFEYFQIPDLVLVKPKRHSDARGYFFESYRKDEWSQGGVDCDFVQDNQSLSVESGVVRGLHFQAPPRAQAKLIRCSKGAILDVAVDIRNDSPTYGQHVAVELSPENALQLYVPVGFAHGFCTLQPDTEVQYKCSDYYSPEHDAGLAFDDPTLRIRWPVAKANVILSGKDSRQPAFLSFRSPFVYSAK